MKTLCTSNVTAVDPHHFIRSYCSRKRFCPKPSARTSPQDKQELLSLTICLKMHYKNTLYIEGAYTPHSRGTDPHQGMPPPSPSRYRTTQQKPHGFEGNEGIRPTAVGQILTKGSLLPHLSGTALHNGNPVGSNGTKLSYHSENDY